MVAVVRTVLCGGRAIVDREDIPRTGVVVVVVVVMTSILRNIYERSTLSARSTSRREKTGLVRARRKGAGRKRSWEEVGRKRSREEVGRKRSREDVGRKRGREGVEGKMQLTHPTVEMGYMRAGRLGPPSVTHPPTSRLRPSQSVASR